VNLSKQDYTLYRYLKQFSDYFNE
jgi:hypothetical protein